jgi:hypothetical protein
MQSSQNVGEGLIVAGKMIVAGAIDAVSSSSFDCSHHAVLLVVVFSVVAKASVASSSVSVDS